jgi:hypothetical protein
MQIENKHWESQTKETKESRKPLLCYVSHHIAAKLLRLSDRPVLHNVLHPSTSTQTVFLLVMHEIE